MHLITEAELCRLLKLSRSTVYKLREKELPYHMVGNSIRYEMSEVTAWLLGHDRRKDIKHEN